MSRHFDLNAAIAAAEASTGEDERWLTFALAKGYIEPRSDEDDTRDDDERRVPWRISRDVPGWLIVNYMVAETYREQMIAMRTLLEEGVDPDQWEQFVAVIADGRNKVSLPILDRLIGNVSREVLGLPLDL